MRSFWSFVSQLLRCFLQARVQPDGASPQAVNEKSGGQYERAAANVAAAKRDFANHVHQCEKKRKAGTAGSWRRPGGLFTG